MTNTRRFILASLLALVPLSSQALSLGKLNTDSTLNEPFEGKIELHAVAPGELDGIVVNLASPEHFAKANIDRPYSLSRLKFETIANPAGQPYIHVYSEDAIAEPFLNFLIEVQLSKNKLVKEYSVILDLK